MSYNSTAYNEDYYKSHCGECYERGNGWEEIFARQAEIIIRDLNPKKTLDVGCAAGYLVEGLRDRGVEAYGVDVSEYALSVVRDDIKPYCTYHSATEPMEGKYDLVTCIEVLEHLQNVNDIKAAIKNLCQITDTIIFSSTPFDFGEETHFSVNSSGYWCEEFAANGFYHDINYDCSYFAVQTMLFRRRNISQRELVREYENKLFELWNQSCILRDQNNLSNARINDLDRGNIEHDKIVRELTDIINGLEAEYNKKLDEFKKRHIEIMQLEYEKRDILENKFVIAKKHQEFLEAELYRYMQRAEQNNNEDVVKKVKKNSFVKNWRDKRFMKKLLKKPYEFWQDVYDVEYYKAKNPDIVKVVGEDNIRLLDHFIRYGMDEGRVASPNFSVNAYLFHNKDVEEHFKGDKKRAILHYIEIGKSEGRVCN